MARRAIKILDGDRNLVATADVEILKGGFSGGVDTGRMPGPIRALFDEYEEIVNNQVFSLLDAVENRIGAIPFTVVFEDGRESRAKDLQIFPGGGTISFQVTEPAMVGGGR
ncbi:MAG: hypothetical protein U0800_03485 [Isosphaeraceae bacterium]